jgi:hypothetical protein
MTTVVDPAGTPVPVYNRSGTTIVSVSGGLRSEGIGDEGTPIPRSSGYTVALAGMPDNTHNVFKLPSGAEIGDVVELHAIPATGVGQGVMLFPPNGESVNRQAASTGTNDNTVAGTSVTPDQGRVFRKVSSTNWRAVGP